MESTHGCFVFIVGDAQHDTDLAPSLTDGGDTYPFAGKCVEDLRGNAGVFPHRGSNYADESQFISDGDRIGMALFCQVISNCFLNPSECFSVHNNRNCISAIRYVFDVKPMVSKYPSDGG